MRCHIAHVALVVRDYDEAISFYRKLHFTLVEDRFVPAQSKRWVTMRPPGAGPDAATIVLQKANTEEQLAAVGNQSGGRVFLFLETDDFDRDYRSMSQAGVEWVREPVVQDYGKVGVWRDLYGNQWDLIQRNK
ncbi:glyoxalase/bleomycin resistance protein/dioxygenase superfamily protein [Metarhizium robertsii]|uniref:Glyoxalase/bleomycin resistance protein/dioxygenase n=2 Tax=Metarhizium robertsii TaxID=568076 RepID=E9EPZ8_METRA|nr:glyoxalase/bleomycin resistance protein/dioxygenase [Metarhizium robertsii ARSEF 23]EFZ02304.1 glyoxalase/bleomycin resistance protein/dioxygenase [Metarhizium robertsii ARSEF 23]EXV05486.1 glyoxalase/bleomycin resistance protein/dioxygenase superfamily protein [Metarhizium robertsii]